MYKIILVGLCLFVLISSPTYAWDDANFAYSMPINTSGATITEYQLSFNFTKPVNMEQNDFDDMRFYSSGGVERPYWIEEKVDGEWAYVWLKGNFTTTNSTDNYVYYGNATATSESNGTATFEEYFDKDSTSGWTKSATMTVTTSGEYLRIYDTVASNTGQAYRQDLILPSQYIMETLFKTSSIGSNDNNVFILYDGSLNHRKTQLYAPHFNYQSTTRIFDGSDGANTIHFGSYTEGTEYIFKAYNDDSNDATGANYYMLDTDRTELYSL
ncbi:DUF2341 domain-containing protein, partial [archaeon]|nr:DUF2341 domain-containing protein [archaeon]